MLEAEYMRACAHKFWTKTNAGNVFNATCTCLTTINEIMDIRISHDMFFWNLCHANCILLAITFQGHLKYENRLTSFSGEIDFAWYELKFAWQIILKNYVMQYACCISLLQRTARHIRQSLWWLIRNLHCVLARITNKKHIVRAYTRIYQSDP